MSASPDEAVDHERVIALLAKRSTLPIDEVTRLYECEWTGLEATARIKRFVPVLTVRRVRELLRKSRIKAPTPPSKLVSSSFRRTAIWLAAPAVGCASADFGRNIQPARH
jgi:hypothetical protein